MDAGLSFQQTRHLSKRNYTPHSQLKELKFMNLDRLAKLRFAVLDRCFSDFKHKYTRETLKEEVDEALFPDLPIGVSLVRIFRDIKYLRENENYNAPIVAIPTEDGKRVYYRYENPDFRIYHKTLQFEDMRILCSTLRQLYTAMNTHNRVKYPSAYVFLKEIIQILEDRLGIRANQQPTAQAKEFNLQGLQNLATIAEAIIIPQPLKLRYRTFNGHEFEVTCHPYQVRLHNNRWLLMAWTEQYGKQGCYALNRIVSLEPQEIPFIMKSNIIHEKYFKNIDGQ